MFDWIHDLPGYAKYLLILVLSAIIYQAAFARPLPLWKHIIVYLAMALGCVLLLIFQIMRFPIVEAMLITIVLVIVAKIRVRMGRSKPKKQ